MFSGIRDETVAIPENGDILNTVNIEYLPVTGESINRVALVESRFLSPENNRKLQESHQSLLRVVMDQPVGTEAFRAYDSEMGLLDSRIGMLGKVKVPRFNQNYIVIHNHPSGGDILDGGRHSFSGK